MGEDIFSIIERGDHVKLQQ
jgi:ankyrin repeat protein